MRKTLWVLILVFVLGCGSAPLGPAPDPGVLSRIPTPAEHVTATLDSDASPQPALGAEGLDHLAILDGLLYRRVGPEEAQTLLRLIAASGDTRFVAALNDLLRYVPWHADLMAETLNALTGQQLPPDWFDWVEWAGGHPEIESFSAYPAWKGGLYANIDAGFTRFLYDGLRVAPGSRVEEIVWGGVAVDGIPALDNPTTVDPAEAGYLVAGERIFGLSINGDSRAYPARFLDWHEMVNDVVGGEAVSLAYCTLCGAAVLFSTGIDAHRLPPGYSLSGGQGPYPVSEEYLTFGSSGLLYRSNKLMYDRNTDTLWHQLLGTPAFGPLVGSGIELERLPVTVTTWEAWLAEHPDTKVMSFDTGYVRDYGVGVAYADYIASPDTMFPVWQRSQILPTKSWVFALLVDGRPKAYPLSILRDERVLNDTLAGQDLVVIYEEGGYGARAYDRKEHAFVPSPGEATTELVDQEGGRWRVTEAALIGPGGKELPRLPGHMAYWFGWYSFFPHTEAYGF